MSAIFCPAGEPSGPGSWPGMRASDRDRDRAMEFLRAAARDGRLTPEELDDRLAAALSSRTLGELTVLTEDLAAGPGPHRIDQRGGSLRRTGGWVVPRRLEVRLSWCDAWLDFGAAVITHDTVHIDVNMRGGSLILVAGPALAVDAAALAVRHGDIKLQPAVPPERPPALRVRLAGRMRYGWIEQR